MVLAVCTTTDRHGEPCVSPRGTAEDESPEFVPLDKGDAALFASGVRMTTPSQSPPYALRKGEKEFVCLDPNPNGF
jgi:hypothetical protein